MEENRSITKSLADQSEFYASIDDGYRLDARPSCEEGGDCHYEGSLWCIYCGLTKEDREA